MYEISADLNITPESSAHLEMNGVTDSPSLSTLKHCVGSFTAVEYWNTIFMRALFSHMVCTQAVSVLGCQVFELSYNVCSQANWGE